VNVGTSEGCCHDECECECAGETPEQRALRIALDKERAALDERGVVAKPSQVCECA
jgi:hypothetical protein